MRRYVILCSVVVVSLVAVHAAVACSCISNPPPLEALEEADAVFLGLVVKTVRDAEDINGGSLFATIKVDKTWKGDIGRQIVVRTAPNTGLCGFPFGDGRRYIVYARVDEDGGLRASLCSRTARIEEAEDDLLALGNPLLDDDEGNGGRCGGPSNVAAMQAMLFVLLAAGFWRRRQV